MALKRCISSFAAVVNGRPHVINVGDLVDDGNELYKGRERLFENASPTAGAPKAGPTVEQATAAPGDKRRTSKPREVKKEGSSDA